MGGAGVRGITCLGGSAACHGTGRRGEKSRLLVMGLGGVAVAAVVAAVVAVVRQQWEQEQGKCTKSCGRLGRVVRWGGCSVRVAAREAVA